MEDHVTILTTTPRWKELCFASALFLLVVILCFGTQASANLHMIIKIILVAKFGIDVLAMGIHYTITKERLIVKWLDIPLRVVKREGILHAAYLHAWRDIVSFGQVHMTGTVYGHIIYVTLKGCKKCYSPDQNRWWHKVSHPFHTACIWLPRDNKQSYIDLFAKYYPSLEIQPIDIKKGGKL